MQKEETVAGLMLYGQGLPGLVTSLNFSSAQEQTV